MKSVILGVFLLGSLHTFDAFAWDCDTNCYDETRVCTSVFGNKICTPPEPVAFATCTNVKATACTVRETENLINNTSSVAWGEAGRGGFPVSATVMLSRNPVFEPLDAPQINFLGRYFDVGFLSQLRIHYYASLLDTIGVQPFVIKMFDNHSAAQAFGADIFIAGPKLGQNCEQYALLAHEIQHSAQALSLGGYPEFGYEYLYQFKQSGMSYQQMSTMGLEGEAYILGDKVSLECQ